MTQFTVVNHNAESTRIEDSRADAEDRVDHAVTEFDVISESDLDVVQGAFEDYADVNVATDGGLIDTKTSPEPTEHGDPGTPAAAQSTPETLKEMTDSDTEKREPTTQLPDDGPSISEDPLTWMPSEFTKTVDGTVTITRKGYEVLAHHYDVQGGTDMVVSPVATDMDYCVHKGTVTDADGDEYTAYGEAHASDNGVENIVRMSDTRAYKRAVSRATGVGTIAIEELQGEL